MPNVFNHSGDLGDIIYSLPTIRACGGGELYIYNHPGRTAHGMDLYKFKRIATLLRLQPYITKLEYVDLPPKSNLNGFRDHVKGYQNLADAHLSTHGLPWWHREKKWLTVDKVYSTYPVVIAKTQRYPNYNFSWARILEKYQGQIGYLGYASEHEWFCNAVQVDLPLIDAPNCLDMARYIAGCKLYVGNFTLATAIAEGLKKNSIIEVCPECASLATHVRLGNILAHNDRFELPDLEDLP
jgi:hypothetical protein